MIIYSYYVQRVHTSAVGAAPTQIDTNAAQTLVEKSEAFQDTGATVPPESTLMFSLGYINLQFYMELKFIIYYSRAVLFYSVDVMCNDFATS